MQRKKRNISSKLFISTLPIVTTTEFIPTNPMKSGEDEEVKNDANTRRFLTALVVRPWQPYIIDVVRNAIPIILSVQVVTPYPELYKSVRVRREAIPD